MFRICLVVGVLFTLPLAGAIINVAAQSNGGVASQSSLYQSSPGFRPDKANDGFSDVSGIPGINHTNIELNAWWEVAFDATYYITSATIYNRTDCCVDRISPFSVFLYDSDGDVVWSQTGNSNPFFAEFNFNGINTFGARFRVQLDGTNYLHMREVEVFADDGIAQPPGDGDGGDPSAVPEPSTYALVGGGLALALLRRRR